MASIHPTAIVEDGATLADDVRIGPYCTVSSDANLGPGVVLESHVAIGGRTRIGANTHIYPFATIGYAPQDMKYAGEASELIIGANNVIREHVTMHPGTAGGGLVTRVGDNCQFLVGAHVAHDCLIHDNVLLVNNVTLGGHVEVHEHAIIAGMSAVHQFARIGKHSFVGGMSGVENDIIPYGTVMGNRATLSGLNIVGLKRRGFSRNDIHSLRNAYRLLFAEEGTLQERMEDVSQMFADNVLVMDIIGFIRAGHARSLCLPKHVRDV